jgi:putative ABC transport system permease protein
MRRMVSATLWSDVLSAVRGLIRRPGAAALIVLSIGVSTGVGTVVFAGLTAILLGAPPGVAQPSRLVSIYTSQFSGATYGRSSMADLRAIGEAAGTLESLAAEETFEANVRVGAHERAVGVSAVSEAYFGLLGLDAVAGDLSALRHPEKASAVPPVVLGYSFFQEIGPGRGAIGQTILLDGRQHRVVAVLPAGFVGLQLGRPTRVWIPLTTDARRRAMTGVARLRDGARIEDLQIELDALSRQLAGEQPATNRGSARSADGPRRFTATAYHRLDPDERGRGTLLGLLLGGATLLILCSACVNTAGILLNRVTVRRREIALKLALGADRWRLVQQLLIETTVVILAGGVAGLFLAHAASFIVPALLTPETADMLPSRPSATLTAGVLLACACTGLICGALPASLVRSTRPAPVLHQSDPLGSTPAAQNGRVAVAVAQIALATVFLLAAASAREGLNRALISDFGSGNSHMLVAAVQTSVADSLARNEAWYQDLSKELSKLGVRWVGWATSLPLDRGVERRFELPLDIGVRTISEHVEADVVGASRNFFRLPGMQLVEGRPFSETSAAPVIPVIVNEVFANRYGGGRASGLRLQGPGGEHLEVVAVARGARYRTVQAAPRPTIYYPLGEMPSSRLYCVIALERAAAGPDPRLRAALEARGMAVTEFGLLDDVIARGLVLDRAIISLLSITGGLSLLLALAGVYGVLVELVSQRTREFGLRMALGAQRSRIAATVLGRAFQITLAGVACGTLLAFVLSRLAATLVWGVPFATVEAIALSALLIGMVVLAAAAWPACRAIRISPASALRTE